MLISYVQLFENVSKDAKLKKQWEAQQVTERIKSQIALCSFNDIDTISSDNKSDFELLDEKQKRTIEETRQKHLQLLTERENMLLDALDTAEDEPEIKNTYDELSVLAERGYVRMEQLENRLSEKSLKSCSPPSSLTGC